MSFINMNPEIFCKSLNAYLAQFDCSLTVNKLEDVVTLVKDANNSTFFKPDTLAALEEIVALYESNKTSLVQSQDDSWIYLAKIRSNVHFIPQIDAGGYF